MSEFVTKPPTEDDRQPVAAELCPLIERLEQLTDNIGFEARRHDLDVDTAERLMKMAVRLYAGPVSELGEAHRPSGQGLSTTETVIVISALMASQDLNTFDLALWQSKLRRS